MKPTTVRKRRRRKRRSFGYMFSSTCGVSDEGVRKSSRPSASFTLSPSHSLSEMDCQFCFLFLPPLLLFLFQLKTKYLFARPPRRSVTYWSSLPPHTGPAHSVVLGGFGCRERWKRCNKMLLVSFLSLSLSVFGVSFVKLGDTLWCFSVCRPFTSHCPPS